MNFNSLRGAEFQRAKINFNGEIAGGSRRGIRIAPVPEEVEVPQIREEALGQYTELEDSISGLRGQIRRLRRRLMRPTQADADDEQLTTDAPSRIRDLEDRIRQAMYRQRLLLLRMPRDIRNTLNPPPVYYGTGGVFSRSRGTRVAPDTTTDETPTGPPPHTQVDLPLLPPATPPRTRRRELNPLSNYEYERLRRRGMEEVSRSSREEVAQRLRDLHTRSRQPLPSYATAIRGTVFDDDVESIDSDSILSGVSSRYSSDIEEEKEYNKPQITIKF